MPDINVQEGVCSPSEEGADIPGKEFFMIADGQRRILARSMKR